MSDPLETNHLKLPYIAAAQAQKHVTHNEALRLLDTVVQLAVLDSSLTEPPASPVDGDRYIVGTSAIDDWAGHDGEIATWVDGEWAFALAEDGWLAYDIAATRLLVHLSGAWAATGGDIGALTELGINATADSTNRLAVKSEAVLFSDVDAADGGSGDIRVAVSKETDADTASLIFQSGFSGRAEIGLAGDSGLVFKVSPDGSAWTEAIRIDKDTGLPAILYDNGVSGLAATNVQDAIDEIAAGGGGGGGTVLSVFGRTGAISAASSDYDASQIDNDSGVSGATVKDALDTLASAKQAVDGDLTAIAALTPANDDVVQRKAGAWTNRTMAQVKTDLALTKGDVGLGNADNTADTDKPVSTATQTALDLKAPLASPTLTGTPAAPTASAGTNTAQLATTAFVKAAIDVVLGGVSSAFDTLSEIATSLAGKLTASSNLSDLGNAGTARTNLGLGDSATKNTGTTTGTVAAGDDSRITGAAQKSSNLSDLGSAGTARSNLGLGDSATKNTGTTTGTVAAGDDSRITGAAQKASNLSDLGSAATAFGNIKQAASDTATGVVELATVAEAGTGTDTSRAVTAAGLFPAQANVASASTCNIGAAATSAVNITGTTTITAFDNVAAGIYRRGTFAGALTLTHNGTSLKLPGGANITTAANDRFGALSLGSGNWIVLWYQKADGTSVVSGGFTAASQAQMEAASSNSVGATPGNQHWHPGHPKAWLLAAGGTTSILASHNITSITDDGVSLLTVTIATDFSSANWAGVLACDDGSGTASASRNVGHWINSKAAGTCQLVNQSGASSPALRDPDAWNFVAFGDQ